ncbi:hypothetical protein KIPB_001680 [Kipferlia bialata]|uniref:Uncharacterized protein n=1 Tax=Kipferlia bialata TaxID=797122 RepID=A0A9K3GFN5_9EUKA|nr:hypothetical protein KIPB_001680 [Kipferlia bialata]|eukprot:g1680.t1
MQSEWHCNSTSVALSRVIRTLWGTLSIATEPQSTKGGSLGDSERSCLGSGDPIGSSITDTTDVASV